MRLGLVSRNNLVLVALFVLAFGSVIVYVSATSHAEEAMPVAAAQPVVPAPEVEPPHGGVPANGPTDPVSETTVAAAEQSASPTDEPLTEKQSQDLTLWSNQIVSAHRTETRAEAIRELGSIKNGESIKALAYALSSDQETDNRLLAVASLNSLAREGYEINAIRDTLRLAAADTDQNVADHAKEAYDELMRKDESQ